MGLAVSRIVRNATTWLIETVTGPASKQAMYDKRIQDLQETIEQCEEKALRLEGQMAHQDMIMKSKRKECKMYMQKRQLTNDVVTKRHAIETFRALKAAENIWQRYSKQLTKMQNMVDVCRSNLLEMEAADDVMMMSGRLEVIRIEPNIDHIIDQNDKNEEAMHDIQAQNEELQDSMNTVAYRDVHLSDESLMAELNELYDPESQSQQRSQSQERVRTHTKSNEGELRVDTELEDEEHQAITQPVRLVPTNVYPASHRYQALETSLV